MERVYRRYKIAHLVGSTKDNEEIFRNAEKLLTRKGYIVFAPVFYRIGDYLSFEKDSGNMIDDMCYEKLLACDCIVVVIPERIGKSTGNRIKQARELGKEVYVIKNEEIVEFNGIEY